MKKNLVPFGIIVLVLGCIACGNGTTDRPFTASLQVNNQAANGRMSRAAAFTDNDTVELYIGRFFYTDRDDHATGGTELIRDSDRILLVSWDAKSGSPGAEGWYSIKKDFEMVWRPTNGEKTAFCMWIDAIRVNGKEYDFPHRRPEGVLGGQGAAEVFFGDFDFAAANNRGGYLYPDKFPNHITITDEVESIKTILTVDPAIMTCWDENGTLKNNYITGDISPWGVPHYNGPAIPDPALDPYTYITVEGRINE